MSSKKKPKYRLEPLLIVKEKHKKQMQIALARAIKHLEEQKEKLKELEKQKEDIIQSKINARRKMTQHVVSGETRVYDSGLHLNYLEKLQDDLTEKEREIEYQNEAIQEAEDGVKKSRRDFIDASRDLQMMEKHKELWMKQIKKLLDAKEEKELGELANVVHQLKHMKS